MFLKALCIRYTAELTKTLRIMKLTAVIFLSACLAASANGHSQNVSLKVKDAPLEKVFNEIKKQTGYDFVYKTDVLEHAGKVTLSVQNASLQQVLDLCFKDQPLTYKIFQSFIAVKSKADPTNLIDENLPPPPIDVHGRVVNEKGEPVAGASVQVKGDKTKGTSTDADGYFTLKGVDESATLVISGTNIEISEIRVGGKTDLTTINTKTKISEGEGVTINTGYQKQKINEITGSVVQINNELFNRAVSTDVLSRLQGITSGLLFQTGNEVFGNNQRNNLLIRSASTIFSNRSPLIVLDNFAFEGDISAIDPADVESVSILKDASSASIWGAKAGNGVIVITTRSGKYNHPLKITFNSSISFKDKPDLLYAPTLSSSDFVDLETFLYNRGAYNGNINSPYYPALSPVLEILVKRSTGQISAADSSAQLAALKNIDTRNDLSKYYLSSPVQQQYNLSLEGGSDIQQYFFSIGYNFNTSKTGTDNRLSINASNTYSLVNHRLEITTGLWYAQTLAKNYGSQYDFTYPYTQLATDDGTPLSIAKYRQGYIDTVGAGKLLDWTYYPLKEKDYANNKTLGINYRFNTSIKFKIIQGLDIDLKYQFGKRQTDVNNLYSQQTYYTRDLINQFTKINWSSGLVTRVIPLGGILDQSRSAYISQNARAQLNYNRAWNGEKHRVAILGGAEISDESTKGNSNRYYGYNDKNGSIIPVDYVNTYPNYITGSYFLIPNNEGLSELTNRYVSLFANGAYTFDGKYTLSASARKDGGNIFGAATNNKWRPLWSSGIKWNIDREAFYHSKWLPILNFRVTYGYQGNINNSIAALLTTRSLSNILNRWRLPVAVIQNYPNANLRWENVAQLNMRLDFGIKKDIISGSIEYYRKKGTDIIGNQDLPPSSGVSSIAANTANIKGQGFDITVNSSINIGKLKWSSNLLFSYAKDWVSNYKAKYTSIQPYVSGGINPIVGRPVSSLYSYKWAGLDPATGDPMGFTSDHQLSKNYSSLISSSNLNDMVYQGPTIAPYFGSFMNSFRLSNFSLSANISYKFGYVFRRGSINYANLVNQIDRGNTDYAFRWQNPGDEKNTNVPSFIYPTNSNRDFFYSASEILTEKGDHIRFQDVRVGYDINKKSIRKLPVETIQIYLYASNLGIIWRSNKLGIDPDYVPYNNYLSGLPGKSYSIGINVGF